MSMSNVLQSNENIDWTNLYRNPNRTTRFEVLYDEENVDKFVDWEQEEDDQSQKQSTRTFPIEENIWAASNRFLE